MESRSERICGLEQLDMEPQYYSHCDQNPVDYNSGLILIPPVLSAQLEVIVTATILQPQRRLILKLLNELFDADQRHSWFTIYLTVFILLHSCALLIAADYKKAEKQGLDVS